MEHRWSRAAKLVTEADVVKCIDWHEYYEREGVPGWRCVAFYDVDEGEGYAWLLLAFEGGGCEASWASDYYETVGDAWRALPAFLADVRAGREIHEEAY